MGFVATKLWLTTAQVMILLCLTVRSRGTTSYTLVNTNFYTMGRKRMTYVVPVGQPVKFLACYGHRMKSVKRNC